MGLVKGNAATEPGCFIDSVEIFVYSIIIAPIYKNLDEKGVITYSQVSEYLKENINVVYKCLNEYYIAVNCLVIKIIFINFA